jgi:hypothetical protein
MLKSQYEAIFPLCDVNTTLTSSGELNSVNMAGYDHATFVLQIASTLSYVVGASAPIISIESGSSDSADTADVTFHWRVNTASAATLSSVMTYGADATSSALSLATVENYAGHTLLLEVDGDELYSVASTNETYKWLTVDFTNATVGTLAAFVILSNARYAKSDMPIAV